MAGHVFAIESIHGEIHAMCKAYKSDENPEFTVKTCEDDLAFEREESIRTRTLEGTLDSGYVETDDYLETLSVYRKLCEKLLDCNILLIHGSCLAIDGSGYLFTAKSGTGKSTHTRNWRKLFGDRVVMVNDDKPLVDVSSMQIFGTPWDGKHHLSTNMSATLKSVVILTRSADNFIREIPAKDALERMMNQTYMPQDSIKKLKTFQLLGQLMQNLRFYVLGCNMDIESAQVAYDGLNK